MARWPGDQVTRWPGDQVARWPGDQAARWLGGQDLTAWWPMHRDGQVPTNMALHEIKENILSNNLLRTERKESVLFKI